MKSPDGNLADRIADVIGAARRHLVLELTIALVVLAAATVYIMRMPNVYRAETRILVNSQRVSTKYVDSAVSIDSNERLNTLSQQVLSSSRLASIMLEFNLFPKLREAKGLEQAIEVMRQHIGIELKQSSSGPSSFRLTYTGNSAPEVAGVTNRLAQSFIDWNLRDRKQEVQGTTEFLSNELTDSKSQLDGFEEQLRNYKLLHVGELPEQMQTNMQSLSLLQVRLQANTEAQNRLDREAFMARSETASGETGRTGTYAPTHAQDLAARRAKARQELAELRERYTPDFPDVKTKQAELAELDRQTESVPAFETPVPTATRQPRSANPHLEVIARDLDRLVKEQRSIESAIGAYQSRVNAEPVREQEMQQLLRDYDTAKEHYRSLLEKTYSAKMATELELKQEGGGYTLLDAARPPDAPISPNRGALLGGAVLFALGAAFAAAFAAEALDSSVKSETDLREILPAVPILGMTPRITGTASTRHAFLRLGGLLGRQS